MKHPMTRAEPPVLEVCDCCGGDGGFDDTYIDTSHEVRSDSYPCTYCDSTGLILIDAEPIEMDDLQGDDHDEEELREADMAAAQAHPTKPAGDLSVVVHDDVQEIP